MTDILTYGLERFGRKFPWIDDLQCPTLKGFAIFGEPNSILIYSEDRETVLGNIIFSGSPKMSPNSPPGKLVSWGDKEILVMESLAMNFLYKLASSWKQQLFLHYTPNPTIACKGSWYSICLSDQIMLICIALSIWLSIGNVSNIDICNTLHILYFSVCINSNNNI